MKIGVAALGRLSEDTGGKNYILHFFRELGSSPTKHQFILFLSAGEKPKLQMEESNQVRIVEVPNSSKTPLHKVIGEQVLLPGYIKRSGVDIMYYPGNFTSVTSSTPAILNIRATAHFYGAQYGVSGVRRVIRKFLMPPSARRARKIIAPSGDIKNDIVRFTGVSAEKIMVIPHGVDLRLFDGEANRRAPEGLALLTRFGLQPNSYILYVSALWRYKNQDKLIEAHAQLRKRGMKTQLVLAGRGTGLDPKYLDELSNLPKTLGTDSEVIFTGGLVQDELRYLYAHASALVFPSSYESFGNPIFEAWASGIPVATANVHSFPEVVGDAGILFDPTDRSAMAGAIERLLLDEKLREQLVELGRERVKNFTWERCVTRTLSLIESVSPTMEAP